MTLVGLEYLKHQETARTNRANEGLKASDIQTRAETADKDRVSKENIASLDRASREGIAAADRQSKESIATLDRASREDIASWDRKSREDIAEADRNVKAAIARDDRYAENQRAANALESKELIEQLNRLSREEIAAAERQLTRDKTYAQMLADVGAVGTASEAIGRPNTILGEQVGNIAGLLYSLLPSFKISK